MLFIHGSVAMMIETVVQKTSIKKASPATLRHAGMKAAAGPRLGSLCIRASHGLGGSIDDMEILGGGADLGQFVLRILLIAGGRQGRSLEAHRLSRKLGCHCASGIAKF
jgi:hypothetical protein